MSALPKITTKLIAALPQKWWKGEKSKKRVCQSCIKDQHWLKNIMNDARFKTWNFSI